MEHSSNPLSNEQVLLSALLTNGLAAVSCDFLWAAKKLGLEEWAKAELACNFGSDSDISATRLLSETQSNAKRMTVEMSNITELLINAGYESTMVHSVLATLSQVMHGKKIPFSDSKS